MIATVTSIIVEAAKPCAEVLRPEHVLVDVFRRHLGGGAGAAAGHRDDEVVELDDAAITMTSVVMKTGRIIGMTTRR